MASIIHDTIELFLFVRKKHSFPLIWAQRYFNIKTLLYVMVIYSLRWPCGDLSPPNRTAALWFLCKPYSDLTVFSLLQGHWNPCIFFTFNFFQKPQSHNTVTTPQGHLAMALWWHTAFTLSWVPRKSHGRLTVPLQHLYARLVVAATTVRVLYRRLPVSLQDLTI